MSGAEVAETVEKTDAAKTADGSSSDGGSKIFTKDILKIPCMRSSLLNGYIGAVIGGLVGFFYTSNFRKGAHTALASYWIVASGSWFTCRYKLYQEKKLWNDLIKNSKETRNVNKDGYNLPVRLLKLNEATDASDNTPAKHG